MKSLFDLRSLPTRMILSTIFVVVVTALTVGLPPIWVIRGQLIQQAWEQLQRGQNTIQALYEARQIELSNLATLITQRPTLQALVSQQNPVALQQYLSTLRGGAKLLRALSRELGSTTSHPVVISLRESNGSKFHRPFVALEIGWELAEYDLEVFQGALSALFGYLEVHQDALRKVLIPNVERRLIVNFNSKRSEERPVVSLAASQITSLARLGASLDVDAYLMF